MKNLIRVGAISAIVMAAISAQAVTFAFQTAGTYTETAGGALTSNEAAPTYRTGHDAGLLVSTVSYNFLETTVGSTGFPPSQITVGSGVITGTYLGNAYTLNFTIGSGGVFRANNTTLKRSFAGDIVTFTISGSALNGYTGSGTFGGTFLGDKNILSGISKTSFDLNAVPEPASMAALGLGLAGIAARRKRK